MGNALQCDGPPEVDGIFSEELPSVGAVEPSLRAPWQECLADLKAQLAKAEDRISKLESWKQARDHDAAGNDLNMEASCRHGMPKSPVFESPQAREPSEIQTEISKVICEEEEKDLTLRCHVSEHINDILTPRTSSCSVRQENLASLEDELDGHKLAHSCWDAIMFFGVPSVGFGGSFCILFGILLTCIGNALFLYVLLNTQETFVNAEHPDVETLRTWRYTIGHSQKNMLSSQSLVSAVCDGTRLLIMASEQAQLAQDIVAYGFGSSFQSGIMLATLVIFMWFLIVAAEVDNACSFAVGVVKLKFRETSGSDEAEAPRKQTSLSSFFTRKQKSLLELQVQESPFEQSQTIAFRAMSCRRLTLNLLVSALRIAVAIVLFGVGAWWLAKTVNVENLVLNAAALQFVLELDEVVYNAFMPDNVKALVEKAANLPGFQSGKVMGINPAPALRFGAAILALMFFCLLILIPQQSEITHLYETLCGGDLNFVEINMDYFPQLAQLGVGDTDDLVVRTDKFKINYLENYAMRSGTKSTWLQYAELQRAHEAGALSLYPRKCEDHNDLHQVELRDDTADFVPFFQAFLGSDNAATCQELKSMCTATTAFWIRFLCPITCGCNLYRGPLWVRNGCPQTCERNEIYLKQEAGLECNDTPQAELQSDPIWKHWWIGNWSTWYTAQWEGFNNYQLPPDCQILNTSNPEGGLLPQLLCAYGSSSQFSGNLRLFCPTTCGCKSGDKGCPASCAALALPKTVNGISPLSD